MRTWKSITTRSLTIIGAVAVAASLTAGTAVAAKKITSGQIKNNTIKSVDIQNGQVRGVDIKNGTIQNRDLSKGAKSNGFAPLTGNVDSVPKDTQKSINLKCPSGKVYAGGGSFWYVDADSSNSFTSGDTVLTANHPIAGAPSSALVWNNAADVTFYGSHTYNAQGDFFAWIHCAKA